MPQWEYDKIDLSNLPTKIQDIDLLNDAGKERWELVGISTNHIAYLKRQINEEFPTKSARRKTATSSTQNP